MIWSTSVLSSISSDTEPTIVVNFENAKFIFNVGENTNRSFLERRQNWKRAKGLFLTSLTTQRATGLTGVLMSLSDATIPALDVVGPPGLTHFIAGMRSFTFRETMPVTTIETSSTLDLSATPTPVYTDQDASIYAIPISPHAMAGRAQPSDELKRKREWEFEGSSKRRDMNPSTEQCSSDSLRTSMKSPDFAPSLLSEELAQEYRRLLVSNMFGRSGKLKSRRMSQEGAEASNASTTVVYADTFNTYAKQTEQIDSYWQRPPLPAGFSQRLPKFSISPTSQRSTVAYAIVGPRLRGKFDVQRANELGVPNGRIRGRLTKGETITFEVKEGDEIVQRTVRPEDCLGESQVPGVILVLDIPTVEHITSLVSAFSDSPFYARLRSRRDEDIREYDVRVVYHILGDDVLEHEHYKSFMSGFHDEVTHIVACKKHSPDPVTFTSAAFKTLQLHQLDPEMFPVPNFSLEPMIPISDIPSLPSKTCNMETDASIRMRPPGQLTKDFDLKRLDRFHPAVTSPPSQILPEATCHQFSSVRDIVQELHEQKVDDASPGNNVVVFPLGTGSSLPTKYRNVLSTLIQIPNWGNVLLDCGEGTWGQLMRRFGNDDTQKVLRDLKGIFISHIHADHHVGLAKVLAQRQELDPPASEPLYLIAPRQVHLYLREWSDIFDLGIEDGPSGNGVKSIMSEALHYRSSGSYLKAGKWSLGGEEPWTDIKQSRDFASNFCKTLGLKEILTVDVDHRVRCYGVVLRHLEDWSIVFSGDTRPCQNLVSIGKNATLLIHEASMGDEEAELAAAKAHSTFGQAVDIGRRMQAKHILLTHFSARYPKMPPSSTDKSQALGKDQPVVALAFDLAKIRIRDMWKLDIYVDAMKQCMDDTKDEDVAEDVQILGVDVD